MYLFTDKFHCKLYEHFTEVISIYTNLQKIINYEYLMKRWRIGYLINSIVWVIEVMN